MWVDKVAQDIADPEQNAGKTVLVTVMNLLLLRLLPYYDYEMVTIWHDASSPGSQFVLSASPTWHHTT